MADAHAEQEPAGVLGVDPLERLRDRRRVVGPHVHDRGGHDDHGGGVEGALGEGETGQRPPSQAQPRSTEAERLRLGHEAHAGVVVVGRVEPCPEGAELW
jgi:hypothetical protein